MRSSSPNDSAVVDRIRHHLTLAVEHDGAESTYHVRDALQLLDVL